MTSVVEVQRPLGRGWLHAGAFALSLPAGVALLVSARGAGGVVAASIFTAGLALCFGTSAAYHRLARSPGAVRVLQRADHAMIYVLIAATYTPVCLLALPLAWGVPLLAVVWSGAVVGAGLAVGWLGRWSVLDHVLYPLLGWSVLAVAPVLVRHLSGTELALMLAGGVTYTLGVPILLLRRPDPWPRWFGYHEIWHVLTVLAAVCHFGAVRSLVA